MKVAFALMFLASVAAAIPADTIDLESVFSNDRLYTKYFDCIMGRAKCPPDGKTFKERLPEIVKENQGNCPKCTDEQKKNNAKTVKFMVEKKPSDFAEFEKMYDPQQTLRQQYS